jgi:hypothetical protein
MKNLFTLLFSVLTSIIFSQFSTNGSIKIKAYNNNLQPQEGYDTICPNYTVNLRTTFFGSAPGVTDIQNNFYPSRIIGSQEWIAKNLNNTVYSNGDAISGYSSANNLASNDSIYGKLYTYPLCI